LAEALRKYHLPPEEAEAWLRDLEAARAALLPAEDKWKSS
jgi:truncated hemoglobin YjbI